MLIHQGYIVYHIPKNYQKLGLAAVFLVFLLMRNLLPKYYIFQGDSEKRL